MLILMTWVGVFQVHQMGHQLNWKASIGCSSDLKKYTYTINYDSKKKSADFATKNVIFNQICNIIISISADWWRHPTINSYKNFTQKKVMIWQGFLRLSAPTTVFKQLLFTKNDVRRNGLAPENHCIKRPSHLRWFCSISIDSKVTSQVAPIFRWYKTDRRQPRPPGWVARPNTPPGN